MAKNPIAFVGNDGSGTFGGKIAESGFNALTTGPLNLLFTTDLSVMGLAEEASMMIPANPGGGAVGTYMFARDFGYIPFVLVGCFAGPDCDGSSGQGLPALGTFCNMAGFAAVFPGPTFTQRAGIVVNVQSDRLAIRNLWSSSAISVGISIFYNRTS